MCEYRKLEDHGGNNVVDVAGEEEDAGDDDIASDAGEQFFISFDFKFLTLILFKRV